MNLVLALGIIFGASLAHAQADPSLENGLSQRLDLLEQQVQDLKDHSPLDHPVDPEASQTFLNPAVSKIYFASDSPWEFGLTSQFFSYTQSAGDRRTNVASLAPAFAYRLHRRLIFNSSVVLENGGAEVSQSVSVRKGQTVVQMAYLDWMFTDNAQVGARVGHQLIPVGRFNTLNDPTSYFGVQPPALERELIPASWHENGLSVWVDRPRATLEAGVFSSLNAQGFRKETFLAGGRSQGQNSPSENLMGVFRLNGKVEHATIGGSIAFGNTAQNLNGVHTGSFQLSEIHADLHWDRVRAYAMTAVAQLQDANSISIVNSTVMPEQARGAFAEIAGEVLGGDAKLWIFTRYGQDKLQDRVPGTFAPDLTLNKTNWVTGVSYFPLPTLVVKGDFTVEKTEAGTTGDGASLGVGLIF